MAAIGLLGSSQQWLMTEAFKTTETMVVMPLDFARLIWAGALGYVLFGEIPDVWVWTGGALIFGSVLYIAYRDSRARRAGPALPVG